MGTDSKGDPVTTQEMKSRYYELGFWGRGTFLDHISKHAKTRPDKTFIWDRGNTYTFSDVQDKVEALAQNLLSRGIGRGSRVAIQVPNWIEFFLLHFALERIGAIIVPLTSKLRAHELEFILGKTKCVAFVSPRFYRGTDYDAMVKAIRPRCPSLTHFFFIDADRKPHRDSFDDLLEKRNIGFCLPHLQSIKDADTYSLKITSGTTAMPKVFMYTENGYVTAAYNVAESMGLSDKDRVAAIAPITQGLGQLVGFGSTTITGCKVVLIPHFDPVYVLEIIERENATVGVAVPTALSKMISAPDLDRYNFSSLRAFQLGGALLPPILARRIEEAFGCEAINTYGSSEGPIPFSTRLGDPEEIRRKTVGRLHPGHEVRIVDSTEKVLPPGEVGEVVSRGPSTS
jgi:non-ribosomal peptide synthetase component E (peptide arylation enzyme)